MIPMSDFEPSVVYITVRRVTGQCSRGVSQQLQLQRSECTRGFKVDVLGMPVEFPKATAAMAARLKFSCGRNMHVLIQPSNSPKHTFIIGRSNSGQPLWRLVFIDGHG